MLYYILKPIVGAAIHLFCHSIVVNKPAMLKCKGPLLIASNHPNSFLDAIIFDILFDVPVTALTRGDAFTSKPIFRLLRALKMLPVYRMKEGSENLNINYNTFDACVEIFKQQEAVLIFTEGFCENEWHLRPLRKGTARLAFKTWDARIPLKVLPVGINYSSFKKFGKKVIVNFGDYIETHQYETYTTDGARNIQFNKDLSAGLKPLVYEINPADKNEVDRRFGRSSGITQIALVPFAIAGFLLHAPLYLPVWLLAKLINKKNVHFDSLVFAVLLLTYPLYLVLS